MRISSNEISTVFDGKGKFSEEASYKEISCSILSCESVSSYRKLTSSYSSCTAAT